VQNGIAGRNLLGAITIFMSLREPRISNLIVLDNDGWGVTMATFKAFF